MKKVLIGMLLVALLCGGCGKKEETIVENPVKLEGTTVAETEPEGETLPVASEAVEDTDQDLAENYDILYSPSASTAVIEKNSIGSQYVTVGLTIKNVSPEPIYISPSHFDVVTLDGDYITSVDYVNCYPNIINPGEIGIFYGESINLTDEEWPDGDGYILDYNIDAEVAKIDRVDLEIVDWKESLYLDGSWCVEGRVSNPTNKTIESSMVVVYSALIDSNNKILDFAAAYITDDLEPDKPHGYSMNAYRVVDHSLLGETKVIKGAYVEEFQF